jgi:hypothetical protein
VDDKTRKKWERAVEDALWQVSSLQQVKQDSPAWKSQTAKLYQILHHLTALRLK